MQDRGRTDHITTATHVLDSAAAAGLGRATPYTSRRSATDTTNMAVAGFA